MDLDSSNKPTHALFQHIASIMCWPEDEKARKSFHRIQHFQMAWMLDFISTEREFPEIRRLLELHRESIGGWLALAEARPVQDLTAEVKSSTTRGDWVGGTLCLAHILHTQHADRVKGQLSLRKVRAFLYRTGDHFFKQPPGPEAANDAWEEFKSVAHLWAGRFFIEHWMTKQIAAAVIAGLSNRDLNTIQKWEIDLQLDSLWTQAMLTMAKVFQDFGLSYKPARSRTPILDANRIWTLVDLPIWPLDPPIIRLTEAMLEIFEDDLSTN
jgi:hypothetical protein